MNLNAFDSTRSVLGAPNLRHGKNGHLSGVCGDLTARHGECIGSVLGVYCDCIMSVLGAFFALRCSSILPVQMFGKFMKLLYGFPGRREMWQTTVDRGGVHRK